MTPLREFLLAVGVVLAGLVGLAVLNAVMGAP